MYCSALATYLRSAPSSTVPSSSDADGPAICSRRLSPGDFSLVKTCLVVAALLLATAVGCTRSNGAAAGATTSTHMNQLSTREQQDGWKLLFDGKTTNGWRNYRKQTIGSGWSVVDGILTRSGDNAGDIITAEQYRNFDFEVDWRVAEGGNSGVMYRATEEGDYPWQSGPEMQILDDERHADGKSPLTSAGSVFALYEAPRGRVHPAGSWNSARLLVNGNHVEHWLNGVKLLEYEFGSDDWNARREKSKFGKMPLYGKAPQGHIALQDHGDRVEFRNIRIKVLP